MKNIYSLLSFLLLVFLTSACNQVKTNEITEFTVDLDNTEEAVLYSQFVKSLDYVELNTNDSCIISGINNLFLDDDTLIVQDTKKAGILIFTSDGKLVNQINHYGNSPDEFIKIRTFTIDPVHNQIYILDTYSQKINTYDYKGKLIESKRTSLYIRDFTVLEDGTMLCFLPYYEPHSQYGIWTTDPDNNIIKKLAFDIPKDDQFEFVGLYTNLANQAVYYYDRNWDNFSYVNRDTAIVQYQIQLKQRLKKELRVKNPETIELKDFAMMSSFSNSENFLLLTYYYYEADTPYRWVLYDKNTQKVTTSKQLINDIDHVQSYSEQVFFLRDDVWCRVLDDEVDNCNVQLQIMNLK